MNMNLDPTGGQSQADVDAMRQRIAELEAKLDKLSGALAAPKDKKIQWYVLVANEALTQNKELQKRIAELEAQVERIEKAIAMVYGKGNIAWTKDRPDLTEAYNIAGDLITEALKDNP
jgi:phage shock protein A